MSSKLIFPLLLIAVSCSTPAPVTPKVAAPVREFSQGEVIMASSLLTKIFDAEMSPISCVPDRDEASLLLRTLGPRMDVVQDDMEAQLDEAPLVDKLISECSQNCTCTYLDDLFKEHQVPLNKQQKKILKIDPKENNRCFNFVQETFCKGDLYRALESEKADFTYDE